MAVTPAQAAAPAAPDLPPAAPTFDELRRARADLAAESARARRWGRLLRARYELLLAASAPLDDLDGGPSTSELRRLVDAPAGDPALVLRLQLACHDLDGYATAVADRRRDVTAALVDRYAADPGAALAVLARHASAGPATDPLDVEEHDRSGLQA